jgi:hypothetical protein
MLAISLRVRLFPAGKQRLRNLDEHPEWPKLPARKVRFTAEGKTRTVWVGPVCPGGLEEHLFTFGSDID